MKTSPQPAFSTSTISSTTSTKNPTAFKTVQQDPTFSCASEVPAHLHDAHHDSRRPIFHPQSARGWSSDPCGPIYFRGRYHLFYQHLVHSCQWYWGLCWDHLVSDDLIHWKNLPPAVVPTPGWFDADGCFSGTVEFDPELGVPVILYTGVYLKANEECVKAHGVPPPEHDPGTRFVERQLAAVPANPDDPDLTEWVKLPQPVIYPAPAGLNISCWRDPFCVQRPAAAGGSGDEWVILLASGIRGIGGAVLRFKSKHFTHGWEFDGLLADGDNTALGIKGQDWECPILTKLPHAAKPPAIMSLPDVAITESNIPQSSIRLNGSAGRVPQEERSDDADGGSSASSVVVEIDPPATAAAAAPTPVEALEHGISQQLLLPKGKPAKGKLSSSNSLYSVGLLSSASAGSLLGVGMYPTGALLGGAGCSTATDTVTSARSVEESEVSSCVISYAPQQQPDRPATDQAKLCMFSSASSDSFSCGEVCSMAQVPRERVASTVDASSSSSILEGSSCHDKNRAADDVLAAEVELGAVAPLTEPVLAAATSAAAADAMGGALEEHPSINVSVWLEQTPDTTKPAAIVAAAQPAVVEVLDAGSGVTDDVIVVISSDSNIDGSREDGKVGPQHATGFNTTSALSNSNSTAHLTAEGGSVITDVMTAPGSSSSATGRDWWFCMSPDACNNPITWWLGSYDGRRFDIAAADGPHRLDLGTTLYAATLWEDPQGRQLLYGWIQEHRRVPTPPNNCSEYSYAGCIGTPRVLHLVDGRLYQQPLPEIDRLRTRVSWHAQDLLLDPNGPLQPLQVVSGTHLDINLTLLPPEPYNQASSAASTEAAAEPASGMYNLTAPGCDSINKDSARVGLVFKSWRVEGRGAAVLSFDWSTRCLVLDFDEPFPDAYNPHPEDTAERRRIGGKLHNYEPGIPLSLRVLLDGSAVEVFTSTGETLTTRLYRGHPSKCVCKHCSGSAAATTISSSFSSLSQLYGAIVPAVAAATASPVDVEDETGVALFAAGKPVIATQVDVWEMGSCWVNPLSLPKEQKPWQQQWQQQEQEQQGQHAAAAAGRTAFDAGSTGSSCGMSGIGSASLLGENAVAAVPGAGEHPSTAASKGKPAAAAALPIPTAKAGAAMEEAILTYQFENEEAMVDAAPVITDLKMDAGSVDSGCVPAASAGGHPRRHVAAGDQACVAGDFLQSLHINNA